MCQEHARARLVGPGALQPGRPVSAPSPPRALLHPAVQSVLCRIPPYSGRRRCFSEFCEPSQEMIQPEEGVPGSSDLQLVQKRRRQPGHGIGVCAGPILRDGALNLRDQVLPPGAECQS